MFLVISDLYFHAMTYCSREACSPVAVGYGHPFGWARWVPCPNWLCPRGHNALLSKARLAPPPEWAFRPWGSGRGVRCQQELEWGLFPFWSLQQAFSSCFKSLLLFLAVVDSHSINQSLKTSQLWKQKHTDIVYTHLITVKWLALLPFCFLGWPRDLWSMLAKVPNQKWPCKVTLPKRNSQLD